MKLDADQRKKLKPSSFAGPGRSYPINDASHARNALSRVSEFGSSSLKREVREKVHEKYPSIRSKSKALGKFK